MAEITIDHVSKAYGTTPVLEDVSLNVPEGSLTVLLGPSGSGKTTMLHIIAGLLEKDRGTIEFDGRAIDSLPIHKRGAVLMDQSVTLFPHMTVEQNVAFGLTMRHQNKGETRKKVKELLDLVELSGHEQKKPSELSGGQMQRVALARALAVEPNVLLLDEPFSKLDITLRASMRRFVKDLVQSLGMTTIMVTHDAAEALSMADQVAVLLDHKLEQVGPPEEVYERPASRAVAEFFGERNYVSATLNGEPHTFILRPDEIALVPAAEGESGPVGTVVSREYTGEIYRYEVESEGIRYLCSTMSHEPFPEGILVALQYSLEGAARLRESSPDVTPNVKKVKAKKVTKKG